MAIDPVCGMEVDEKAAKFKSEYKGKTSAHRVAKSCLIKKDPEKYLKK